MNDEHCAETYIHGDRVQAALPHVLEDATASLLAETF